MGMFDSLYDDLGHEWQTKAYYCGLSAYKIGVVIPSDFPESYPTTYQVEILGGEAGRSFTRSLATVRDGVLESVHDRRDVTLPLINYSGHLTEEGM